GQSEHAIEKIILAEQVAWIDHEHVAEYVRDVVAADTARGVEPHPAVRRPRVVEVGHAEEGEYPDQGPPGGEPAAPQAEGPQRRDGERGEEEDRRQTVEERKPG